MKVQGRLAAPGALWKINGGVSEKTRQQHNAVLLEMTLHIEIASELGLRSTGHIIEKILVLRSLEL